MLNYLKKFTGLAAALALVGCCTVCNDKTPLAEGGKAALKQTETPMLKLDKDSKLQIVMADSFANPGTEPNVMRVARQLQAAFRETLGVTPAIVKEAKADASMKHIYLGGTRAINALGYDVSKLENYNCWILVRNGDIYLAGFDGHRFGDTKPDGGDTMYIIGSCKAAVSFMENFMDVRFLMAGENGAAYLKKDCVEIPADYTEFITPRMEFATGRGDICYRYSNSACGQGRFKSYGGHSYYDACPASKYAKTHPEYFILRGGKRDSGGNHLCISNPEVQELIYQEIVKWIKKGANTVQLAQTDGYMPCECDKCKAYGNTDDNGEKLWILHRKLAQRLEKEYPGKRAHIICYGPTAHPPKTFKTFPDNVVIELCNYGNDSFAEWRDYRVKCGFTTYIYNWGWYQLVGITPKTTPKFVARQARDFIRNNVVGIYRCGFGNLFGTEGPSYYVFGKILENPDLNEEELFNEYCERGFGKAAAPMKTFYRTLYDRLDSVWIPYMESAGHYNGARVRQIFPMTTPQNPRIMLCMIYSADLLKTMEDNLKRAEKLADTEPVKARLRLTRAEFDYQKNLGTVLSLYNSYLLVRTQEAFDQLAKALEERNALIDSYYDKKGNMKVLPGHGHDVRFLGSIEKQALLINGRNSAPIHSPLTWNVKFLKEKGILPGTFVKKMTIKRAAGAVDMDFENGPAWKNVAWEEINGLQMDDVWDKNKMKVTYDNENLYIAVEAQVVPGTEYIPKGFDNGSVCGQDCVEILLDPKAERQQYYHFAFNPIDNSYYDAAFGLEQDPLSPVYNKVDEKWNGKWSYRNELKGDTWKSLAVIPFATVNAPAPKPGTTWVFNVGREAYQTSKLNGKRIGPALSMWSPNLETVSFHEKETFGEAVFE